MKKKVLSIIGVAAVGAAVAFNVSVGLSCGNQMELTLDNIEAAAHTVGCESALGTTVLYYCKDDSPLVNCTCAGTHWGHLKSFTL